MEPAETVFSKQTIQRLGSLFKVLAVVAMLAGFMLFFAGNSHTLLVLGVGLQKIFIGSTIGLYLSAYILEWVSRVQSTARWTVNAVIFALVLGCLSLVTTIYWIARILI